MTTDTIQKVRKHMATSRSMQRNLRLGRYQGRNGGGAGFRWHERQAEELMAELPRELEGRLRAEQKRRCGSQRTATWPPPARAACPDRPLPPGDQAAGCVTDLLQWCTCSR